MKYLYNDRGLLLGAEHSEKVSIQEWIQSAETMDIPNAGIFACLRASGSAYDQILAGYPEGIAEPTRTMHRYCHQNNILYAAHLMEMHPESIGDFRFVSGFYGMRAESYTEPFTVPEDKRYFISLHSFLLYKGSVLDCTVLRHPPLQYVVDQYYGMCFEIETVVHAFDKALDGEPMHLSTPLELLANEPYLE